MLTRPVRRARRPAAWAAWGALWLLAACSATPDDPAALTADEDRRLNAAAAQADAAQNAAPDPVPAVNESSAP